MKAKNEFKSWIEYEEYLKTYIMIEAMKGILFQNIMFAESDGVAEANDPKNVSKKAFIYAKTMLEVIKKDKF